MAEWGFCVKEGKPKNTDVLIEANRLGILNRNHEKWTMLHREFPSSTLEAAR